MENVPSGKPDHPLKKVPGYPKRVQWDPEIGRWVIYRKVNSMGTRVTP